ncbi:hypothetical protein GP486_007154, partial [Trichoglossum hirsutum]
MTLADAGKEATEDARECPGVQQSVPTPSLTSHSTHDDDNDDDDDDGITGRNGAGAATSS